jgi:hypothetical protein
MPRSWRSASDFGRAVEGVLMKHQKAILEREYVQQRLSDAAIEIFNSSAVLSRLDSSLSAPTAETPRDVSVGTFYLKSANRRIKQRLTEMGDNDDADTTTTANLILDQYRQSLVNGSK